MFDTIKCLIHNDNDCQIRKCKINNKIFYLSTFLRFIREKAEYIRIIIKMSAPTKRFMPGDNIDESKDGKWSTVQGNDSKRDAFLTWAEKNDFQLSDKVLSSIDN